jgi:recombination protein RecT
MKNEIQLTEKSQSGILSFANDFIKNNNIILSKSFDLPTAMTSLFLNLQQVKDRQDRPALEVCSPVSIQEAVIQCINEEINVGKKQGYFIVYGDKLTFQPSYFGNVKKAKAMARVKINSNVIREDEQADIETRIDGSIIIKHKPSIKCLNKPIVAVYAVATDIDSERVVNSDIMSMQEVKRSWLKSQNGGKVAKEFEHEMARRTVENRLAKHFINKSDDTERIIVTDANGNDIVVSNYDELPQVDVEYTINSDEQIERETKKYEPKEEDTITLDDLQLEPIDPRVAPEIPEGAIKMAYKEYKNNQDKYELVKGSYSEIDRTCYVLAKGE